MKLDNASDLVRKCFSTWETKDREALEELLAEDFTFTSPNDDDHISKQGIAEVLAGKRKDPCHSHRKAL